MRNKVVSLFSVFTDVFIMFVNRIKSHDSCKEPQIHNFFKYISNQCLFSSRWINNEKIIVIIIIIENNPMNEQFTMNNNEINVYTSNWSNFLSMKISTSLKWIEFIILEIIDDDECVCNTKESVLRWKKEKKKKKYSNYVQLRFFLEISFL